MLDLLKLESFRMVANTRSFTRAAAELGYSQSSVTAHVQALERELGAPLIERSRFSREIALTETGRRTLEYATRLLALAEETSVAIHSRAEPSGQLKICTSPLLLAYRLPRLLRRYSRQYPQVKLCFSAYPDARMLASSVVNGAVDAAFVFQESNTSDRVIAETLTEEDLLVVCSPEHPFASRRGGVTLEDLAGNQALFSETNCSIRAIFERVLMTAGLRPGNTIEAGSVEAAKRCAAACLGFAILPRFACEQELSVNELVVAPARDLEIRLSVQIVRNAKGWLSPAVRELWSMAVRELSIRSAA